MFTKKSSSGHKASKKPVNILDAKLAPPTKTVAESDIIHLLSGFYLQQISEPKTKSKDMTETFHDLGVKLGQQILERVFQVKSKQERILKIEDALFFIQKDVWPYLFNKELDELQMNTELEEYYLVDKEPILDSCLSNLPKSTTKFSNMHLIAGVVESIMLNLNIPVKTKVYFNEADLAVVVIKEVEENQLQYSSSSLKS